MNTIQTVIFDNLFNKHLTHIWHIFQDYWQERFVFCKLDVLIYLNWNLPFFREQYTFILQTSSDIIDLTGVFYQTIIQHINGNFVFNKRN